MKILAAVAHGNRQPLALEQVDLAEPADGEILVRLVATGICGTDLSMIDHVPMPWPAVFGHEGAGIVERTGCAVTTVAPGDHVILSTTSCGHCPSCQRGALALPLLHRVQHVRGPPGGRKLHHAPARQAVFASFLGQSSFAAYVLSSERNTIKVDKDLPLDILAPFGCGIQTGAGAVLNTLKVEAGRSIAVFGAGAVGLSAMMAARIAGCGPITVVDTNTGRLELARELGADRTINAMEEDAVAALRATGGVDYAVEAAGIARVMEDAVEALGVNGQAALVGVASGQKVSLDPSMLQARGLTVKGTLMAGKGALPAQFVTQLIAFWQAGKLPVERMIRHYEFCQINEAIAAAKDGSAVKPILRFPEYG